LRIFKISTKTFIDPAVETPLIITVLNLTISDENCHFDTTHGHWYTAEYDIVDDDEAAKGSSKVRIQAF